MARPDRPPGRDVRSGPVTTPGRPPDRSPAKAAGLPASLAGPFQTRREADDAARHIYHLDPGTGAWQAASHRMLEDACTAAGVTLGAFDQEILLWLAGWTPSTVAVLAGLISRARAR